MCQNDVHRNHDNVNCRSWSRQLTNGAGESCAIGASEGDQPDDETALFRLGPAEIMAAAIVTANLQIDEFAS